MAFNKANFAPVGNVSGRGGAPSVFAYTSTGENLATVKGSGYFNSIATLLNANDVILVNLSDGFAIITIAAITAGVVTTTAADVNAT